MFVHQLAMVLYMGVIWFITDNLKEKTSLPLDRSGGAKTSTYPPSLAFMHMRQTDGERIIELS